MTAQMDLPSIWDPEVDFGTPAIKEPVDTVSVTIDGRAVDVPMDYEAMAEAGAMLGHGGIVVFDETVDMAKMARFAMEFCSIESCGKCTPCRVGSTRGVETIDRIIAKRGSSQDVSVDLVLLDDLCDTMTKGSLCAMGGLTPMPVQSAIKHFPEDFERHDVEQGAPA